MLQHLFSSSGLYTVDPEGCVSLPPFIRAVLERRSDSTIMVIGAHETDPCLRAYDRGHAATLHAEHERLRPAECSSAAHYARGRQIFGFTEEASYGSDGRFKLPPLMRRKGKIEELALFVGAGATFEIWNPQLALEAGDAALRELAGWRLQDFAPAAD